MYSDLEIMLKQRELLRKKLQTKNWKRRLLFMLQRNHRRRKEKRLLKLRRKRPGDWLMRRSNSTRGSLRLEKD